MVVPYLWQTGVQDVADPLPFLVIGVERIQGRYPVLDYRFYLSLDRFEYLET